MRWSPCVPGLYQRLVRRTAPRDVADQLKEPAVVPSTTAFVDARRPLA